MEFAVKALFVFAVFLTALAGCKSGWGQKGTEFPGTAAGGFSAAELHAFTALQPIDAHAHVLRVDPGLNALLDRLNLHLLDILLVDDKDPNMSNLQAEKATAEAFIRSAMGRAALCTSFDPYNIGKPKFAANAIRSLDEDFAHGAVAVKVYKNLGMEIRNAKGNPVLPDDPALSPIYADISAHNITMIAHFADPDSAWQPPNPASPDYSYYQENPQDYMYGKPNQPSKATILAARDNVLRKNPKLRVVGAHLGSMESDFKQLAQHLDRYPNFTVDLAARTAYLMLQPRSDAIAFILKYQDRLIYGSDLVFIPSQDAGPRLRFWEREYARDWRFFATNDTVEADGVKGQGLALPNSVLRKIYHDNAIRWFPGIIATH